MPKFTVPGDRKTGGGVVPVPVSGTVCGLDESLSVMVSVALSGPTIDGVNVIAIVHVPLTGIAPVQVEVPRVKSGAFAPLIATPEIDSALLVRFASVTTSDWLVIPTGSLPKLSVDGLRTTPVAAAGDSFARNADGALNAV